MKIDIPAGEFAGFIFDCDGTLADTMPLHYRAWSQAFHDFHAPFDFTEDKFYSLGGVPTNRIVAVLNEEYGTDCDCAAISIYKENLFTATLPQARPIAEVCEYARRAAAAGFPVAVASGGLPQVVKMTLELIGMYDLFKNRIVTPDMVEHGKPAPDIFLYAAHMIGVAPGDCLVFEDAAPGIAGARAAGMQVALVHSRPINC